MGAMTSLSFFRRSTVFARPITLRSGLRMSHRLFASSAALPRRITRKKTAEAFNRDSVGWSDDSTVSLRQETFLAPEEDKKKGKDDSLENPDDYQHLGPLTTDRTVKGM